MEECPICFEELIDKKIITGCCNKYIHYECFNLCIQESQHCPFCRDNYPRTVLPESSHINRISRVHRIDNSILLVTYVILIISCSTFLGLLVGYLIIQ